MATAQSKWEGVGYLKPAFNILARLYGNINLQGLIAPPGIGFDKIKILNKEDLKNLDYDLILVFGNNASLVPILKDAETLDIDEDKIVLDRTVCIPLFTLEKYKKLRRSKISILSMNLFRRFHVSQIRLAFSFANNKYVCFRRRFFKVFEKSDSKR